ncbi:cytochrome c [Fulvimarina endophytica]|uniref:Cytochrome c n=1 Tax=Fulvimarina endophytica TaxID=2293836 RepID=A0A371X9Q6_9HYPH|nr:cytochrome c [Fulvimarina endophytica]RFC65960.1 cytochrome c [Fulvimarina endophytica]
MKTVLLSTAGLAVLVVAAFFAFALSPEEIEAVERPAADSFDAGLVAKGRDLAALGNCLTCHRSEGGAPYAGGYGVETPVGTIYGSNITPDPETGIGRWSEAAFVRSMREGLGREGEHLYPAFPYTHFTRVTDGDLEALYAFLMTREAVAKTVPDPDLPFPMNVRPLLAAWKLLFFDEGAAPLEGVDDELERGRYLVDGLGHCGACHTPRNLFLAERSDAYLRGGEASGWANPPLAGDIHSPSPWSADEITTYLRGGFAETHGTAAGPMAEVAAQLKDAPAKDVLSMATYLVSLQTGVETPSANGQERPAQSERVVLGETLYRGACARCHEASGEGVAFARGSSQGLPLSQSTALHAPDGRNFAQFVLYGVEAPKGEAGWPMPGFADLLTDEQIAAIADYLRHDLAGQPAWDDMTGRIAGIRSQGESGQ